MVQFLSLKKEAFGIDISDLSLKFAKLKKRGKFFDLDFFGEKEIEPGIIKEGEIKHEKRLAEITKEATKKVKTKYVVASLPEEKAFLQVIKMPRLSEEDLKSAVVYEAEKYIPLPVDQVYLDSQIIQPVLDHQENYEVLISAIPKKVADGYLNSLKLAGLKPIVFEVESMAVARALIENEISQYPILIIDLGATRTSFVVFSGKTIKFTSSIPISSHGFTQIISKTLGVDLKEAERLKIKYGLEEKIRLKVEEEKTIKKMERGRVFEALIPPLVDLVQQIKKCIEFYESHTPGEKIKEILLCGGGANLKGLPELLAVELNLAVKLGNPWLNILEKKEKESKKMPLEKSLSFTTALGLALRAAKAERFT
jgi:type IV pilus assembly protein PilM